MTTRVFEDAQRGIKATNPSVAARELIALLERHGTEEGAVLAHYERIAEQETTEAVRYLVGLIIEDERRHHRVIEEIANSVAWEGLAGPDVATVPEVRRHSGSPELLAATHHMLGIERSDAAALTRLRRKLKEYADPTVWTLLVELMLLDTEKHERILEFIAHHVARR